MQLLVAAEDDVLLLEVGGEVHGDEGVHAGGADVVVTTARTRILPAAHRAVGDVDHVLDRTPDHTLGTGVGAAADGHQTRQRLLVGGDALLRLFQGRIVRRQVLRAVLAGLLGIDFQDFLDEAFDLFA
ncbi:hypothetical protein D3C72_1541510 [compost metagenome]